MKLMKQNLGAHWVIGMEGKADEIEQKAFPVSGRLKRIKFVDRIDPFKAELGLRFDRRNILNRRKRRRPLIVVGNICVEQC